MSDGPSGPRVLSVRAAAPLEAKSAQGPTVSSAHPSFGDQGTTLDVQFADLLDEFGDDPQGRFWDQLPALSPLLR